MAAASRVLALEEEVRSLTEELRQCQVGTERRKAGRGDPARGQGGEERVVVLLLAPPTRPFLNQKQTSGLRFCGGLAEG